MNDAALIADLKRAVSDLFDTRETLATARSQCDKLLANADAWEHTAKTLDRLLDQERSRCDALRAVLEECRPLVKARLIDADDRLAPACDHAILDRINAALANPTVRTAAVPIPPAAPNLAHLYARSNALAVAMDALAHCAASLDHLLAFKGSRLEESQRAGHLLNLKRAREALGQLGAPPTHPDRSSADDCAKP